MWRRLALHLSFITVETLGFYIIAAVLAGSAGRSAPAYPSFFLAEAGGFFLVRGLLRFELSSRTLVTTGALLTLVALVTVSGLAVAPTSFPPGWDGVIRFFKDPGDTLQSTDAAVDYSIILFIVAWARGVQTAQNRLERDRVLRSFSLGLSVLVLGLLFSQNSPAKAAVNTASIPLVAFGLLTLTLLHLRDARPSGGDTLRGPWTFISAGTVLVLVGIGLAVGVFPLGPAGFVFDHVVAPALGLAVVVIAWVLVALAFPFAWIISVFLKWIINPSRVQNQTQPDQTAPPPNPKPKPGAGPAPIAVLFAKVLIIAIILAILIYLAYRLYRRLHPPPEEDEDRESISGEGSIWSDLAALWRSIRPHRPFAPRVPDPDLSPRGREVRRLYLRLLEVASSKGRTRHPAATPVEFEPQLEAAVAAAAAQQVTEAFVKARYGLEEPSEAELERLREAVHHST